ncbi:MAG: hypothetical protein KDK27_12615, partial [Leptospiraceae bacterium]|nr:hypothetical protein [Leptospiraceae bacterium]
MQSKNIITFILTAFVALSLSYCEGGSGINDRLLYGFTADTSNSAIVSPENTCTTDVTVQSTTVSLIEFGPLGGDQTRAWQSTSPFYTDTDTNGGPSSYGLFRQEVCIYLVQPFNGDVEIPVSV